jgi:hypothetical protein
MAEASFVVEGADAVTLVDVADQPPPRWLLMYVVAGAGVPRYLEPGDLPAGVDPVDGAAVGRHVEAVLADRYAVIAMAPAGEEAAAWILRPPAERPG